MIGDIRIQLLQTQKFPCVNLVKTKKREFESKSCGCHVVIIQLLAGLCKQYVAVPKGTESRFIPPLEAVGFHANVLTGNEAGVMRLEKVVPFGRSLDEYIKMFNLSELDFKKRILGVGD